MRIIVIRDARRVKCVLERIILEAAAHSIIALPHFDGIIFDIVVAVRMWSDVRS